MRRSNVIIVGSVVLAPLILGVESYALYRAHHRRVRTAELTGLTEMSAGPVQGAPAAQTVAVPVPAERPSPSAPPPPPPAPTPPAAGDPPPDTETVSDVQTDPTVERRRQLMLQRRGEIVQAADEQVFDLLHLTDEQRAAIRSHRRRLRAHRPGDRAAPPWRRPSRRGTRPQRRAGAPRGDR